MAWSAMIDEIILVLPGNGFGEDKEGSGAVEAVLPRTVRVCADLRGRPGFANGQGVSGRLQRRGGRAAAIAKVGTIHTGVRAAAGRSGVGGLEAAEGRESVAGAAEPDAAHEYATGSGSWAKSWWAGAESGGVGQNPAGPGGTRQNPGGISPDGVGTSNGGPEAGMVWPVNDQLAVYMPQSDESQESPIWKKSEKDGLSEPDMPLFGKIADAVDDACSTSTTG